MKIYSPSKTEGYDFCSMAGKLMYTEHWEPREATNGTMGKIVGAAFAHGSEFTHNRTGDGIDSAVRLFDATVAHYVACGVSFSMDISKVRGQLEKALGKYNKANPFEKWEVVATEMELEDHGRCRLDVVGMDPDGYWSIADIKYKRSLKIDYLSKTIREYQDSWQFNHYPWAYNNRLNKLMDGVNDHIVNVPLVSRIWVVLVIADPFMIHAVPFAVNEGYQKIWLASAQQKWVDIAAIESGDRLATVSTTHRNAYGDCPMKKACLEYGMDPQLMQFDYVKVPRLVEPSNIKELG